MRRLICFLMLICFARLSASAQTSAAVPLQVLPSGHIAVEAYINGHGPYRLILDTGSPITLVDTRVAALAGLQAGSQSAAPSLFPAAFLKVKTFALGNAALNNLNVVVMNHPVVSILNQVEGPIDGIVGLSFWGHFHLTLNYASGTLLLRQGSYSPPNIVNSVLARFSVQGVRMLKPAGEWGMVVHARKKGGRGVRIARVYSGSRAAQGGILPDDVLLSIDGRWTDTLEDCYRAAEMVQPGKTVPVKVERAGKKLVLQITPSRGM